MKNYIDEFCKLKNERNLYKKSKKQYIKGEFLLFLIFYHIKTKKETSFLKYIDKFLKDNIIKLKRLRNTRYCDILENMGKGNKI